MRRLRNGGTQVIRVERIEVSDTAQAIIGNVNTCNGSNPETPSSPERSTLKPTQRSCAEY
jgi:hypothetical protein